MVCATVRCQLLEINECDLSVFFWWIYLHHFKYHLPGCSPATSPTGQIDASERMDDDESHDARPVMTLTAEDMAAAAKVALIMAHPLEAPKRVACAVCQKRFKNQSALNGHMRLHGGYGPAGIGVSSVTHTSSTTTSTQSKTSKSHPSEDCHYSIPMDFDEKNLPQGKTDPIGIIRSQVGCASSSAARATFIYSHSNVHSFFELLHDESFLYLFLGFHSMKFLRTVQQLLMDIDAIFGF